MDGQPFSHAGRGESATLDPVSQAQNPAPRSSAAFGGLLRSDILRGLLVFAGYVTVSLIFFGRSLLGHFSSHYVGHDTVDPSLFMWFLRWWPYALRHHLNPFVTDLVWAPVGFNVTWTTGIPLAGVLLAPLTRTIGLVATYNLVMLSAPVLAGIATYALCRRVTGAFWPAAFGGYLFGFSPYMLCQIRAHAHLALIFPIPLSVLLVVCLYQASLTPRSFTMLYALVTLSEFLLSVEMFALTAIVTGLALCLSVYVGDEALRGKALRLFGPVLAGWALASAAVAPYAYYMLQFGQPAWPIWPAYKFSTDLLNFVIPTPVNLVGANRWLAAVSSNFTGNSFERTGYVAFPLIAIVAAWSTRNWTRPLCRALVALLAAIAVATLGPFMQIGGKFVLPMPWMAIQHLPTLEHALPARLTVFAFLIVAVVAAQWLAESRTTPRFKAIAAALVVMLTLPNPSSGFWVTRVDTPRFFSDGASARYLAPSDIVLTLPWGDRGISMLWQAECDMCFRNVAGWTGISRFEVRRWPIVNYFLGDQNVPEPELQLKAFLARLGVNAIVIDDANPGASDWNALVSATGLSRIQASGVSFYRIRPGPFAEYRALSGLEMEKRANEARFDMVLAAARRYLAAGHDPRKISRSELITLGLLPVQWTKDPRDADAFVFPSDGGIGISEIGSRAALDGLIERYAHTARIVFFPYPRILSGKENVSLFSRIVQDLVPPFSDASDGEAQHFLCVVFDLPQLEQPAGNSLNAR